MPGAVTENETAQNGCPVIPWRTSRIWVRWGSKPASGRAFSIACSLLKRICDCWQLWAANAVTASSARTAARPRHENRAGARVRFSAKPSRPSA